MVHGPLTVVASLFMEHGLPVQVSVVVARGLRLPCGMWSLPRPRIEPGSSALAGGFLTPGPPGKSSTHGLFSIMKGIGIVTRGK